MLNLGRRTGQEMIIEVPPSPGPTRIVVKVCQARPDKATLGFEAPRSCSVHRREVWDRIQAASARTSS